MADRETLIAAGIDADDLLQRTMGSDALVDKLLALFLQDENHRKLVEAMEAHDEQAAIAASHALKGVSGNLSLTTLFELTTQQLALLRAGNWDDAAALMPGIDNAYRTAIEALGAR